MSYHRAFRLLSRKLLFFSDCVGWPQELLPALEFLIDKGEEIDREELLERVDIEDAENSVPKWDWHIRYYRYGDGIYWYDHSAIEHVYAEPESIGDVQRKAVEAGY